MLYYNEKEIGDWTIRDLEKQTIAKQNKIKYIAIYSEQEMYDVLNKYRENKND
jgi:hypothetical protein